MRSAARRGWPPSKTPGIRRVGDRFAFTTVALAAARFRSRTKHKTSNEYDEYLREDICKWNGAMREGI